jgi:hypothetical protein
VNLADRSVSRTGWIDDPGWLRMRFASADAEYLVDSQAGAIRVLDGCTGELLALDWEAVQLLQRELGFDIQPYLRIEPSAISILPTSLTAKLLQLQQKLFH